jgi:exodeoxyribonuclease V alpha subunit
MTPGEPPVSAGDPFDAARPLSGRGLLATFAEAGILHAADVHAAGLLGRLAQASDPGAGEDGAGAASAPGAPDTGAAATALRGSGPRRADGESVLLAAALAVRALRLGSVCVDLESVGRLASPEGGDVDRGPAAPGGLPGLAGAGLHGADWPDPDGWLAAVASSPLVSTASEARSETPGPRHPLRLEGSLLYLDRYWHDEQLVAGDIAGRARRVEPLDEGELARGLARLFPGDPGRAPSGPDLQRIAAATAALSRFAVVSGGPGTGKTTTVARLLVLVHEQSLARGEAPPLVALAAPTGKAAARLEQAVRQEAGEAGGPEMGGATRAWLGTLRGSTLHRLLGRMPGTETRFRHDARNHLPHDLVVVDEASMVALSLMARLLEAVRPDARVVLVGDHEQLASVEAGSVLGDIVGPAADGLRMSGSRRAELAELIGRAGLPGAAPDARDAPDAPDAIASPTSLEAIASPEAPDAPEAIASPSSPSSPEVIAAPEAPEAIGDCVVVLRRVHRFGGAIAELATAIQRADAGAALEVLGRRSAEVGWRAVDAEDVPVDQLGEVRELAVNAGAELLATARCGDAAGALHALGRFRLLCANRRGPYGVATWQEVVEGWIAAAVPGFAAGEVWAAGARFYPGLPLLVTANDHDMRLYNGDAGVVIESDEQRLAAVFESAGPSVRYGLDRLGEVERCFASTVHKSQGSQFDAVAVVLPDPASPILTRELLYTAVTRARERVVVVGTADAVRTAIERPIARASGLRRRLWRE